MADEAVRVGPAVAADSYLNMEAVLDAIKNTGANAVSNSSELYGLLLLSKKNLVFPSPPPLSLSYF